jgi:hypothetical protein
MNVLEDLIDNDRSRAVDAGGLFMAMKEPMFLVTILILHRLLGSIKILSDQWKGKFIICRFILKT